MDFFELRARRGESADPETEALASQVIGAAIEVHRALHAGLPEGVYQKALEHELTLRRIPFVAQAPVPVMYKGVNVGTGYVDLLIDGRLVVELKSVASLDETHRDQVIAYLVALQLRLGLLINFNVFVLKNGVKRVVHDPPPINT
jgi:GxxExxY protein